MVSFRRKIVSALFFVLLSASAYSSPSLPKVQVRIGKVDILVEIPNTPSLQHKGLGKRDYLAEFEGMLFIFPTPDTYAFHMKDMRFPIDIIWIRSNVIVDITKNVPVPTGMDLPTYQPDREADMVLEVNAYFTDRHNIRLGDRVDVHPVK
jgi:uncharacterized membrane protein (UPF0127 family)